MAINPETQYPGKIAPSTPDYPYGAARNVTLPGTGTPWEAALVNDLFGWQQAILSEVGVVPSGSPEKVGASQYLGALKAIAATSSVPVFENVPSMLAGNTLSTGVVPLKEGLLLFAAGYNTLGDKGGTHWRVVTDPANGIDILQTGTTGIRVKYVPGPVTRAAELGAFPNPVATGAEDVSPILLRAAELAGGESVEMLPGGFNTGTADFKGLNFHSFGNARSYQTTSLRATDLSQSENDSPLGHSIIDMHYSVLRGTGARAGEAQSGGNAGSSDLPFDVSAPANVGDNKIQLVSAAPLVTGQLIAYGGEDGEFYTAKITAIVSNELTVAEPVEAPISTGQNVFAYYRNDYHPSDTGYKAIADHALRESRIKRTVVARADLSIRGTGTLTPITVNDQSNPGSYRPATPEAEVPSVDIVSPGTSASVNGAQAQFSPPSAGSYEVHVVINTEGEDVVINWIGDGGFSRAITVNNDSPTLYRAPAFVYGGGSLTVTLGTTTDGGTFKAKTSVHLVCVENREFNLNRGTHVAMGDSWFAEGPLIDRLQERLPNAVIFNKGVGGEKAADINSRFQSDAVPLEPDFVWFISGTNDWFGFVDPTLFAYQLGQFKANCNAIGATCLMFTSSVAPDADLANQWSWSRAYLEYGYYEDEDLPSVQEAVTSVINVPAGVPVQLGRYVTGTNPLEIVEHFLNSSCDVIEASSLVGADATTVLPSGFVGDAGVTIAPVTAKFIRLESASAGYVIIKEGPKL